jgi:two-component system, OmpR family, sensor histidine kinase SenX3
MTSSSWADWHQDPVNIVSVVQEAVALRRSGPRGDEVELIMDPNTLGSTVWGVRRDLITAVLHLIDNGLAFSKPSSGVAVAVRGDHDWVDIAVIDHGVGIDSHELSRIFDRFYRVDPANPAAGMGLGLPIVRHVATSHGGSVSVLSVPTKGSTFTVRLPRHAAPT